MTIVARRNTTTVSACTALLRCSEISMKQLCGVCAVITQLFTGQILQSPIANHLIHTVAIQLDYHTRILCQSVLKINVNVGPQVECQLCILTAENLSFYVTCNCQGHLTRESILVLVCISTNHVTNTEGRCDYFPI